MRIMEKTIAVLLVICMMFSFLPVDMMSGVLEDVFADVPSDSNYTVTSKTPGEYTPGGPLSRGQPGIRVVLSRDPDTYLNGTEEALNAMYNAFSYKYPISATDNSNFMENSLFILDDNKDGGVYRKWSGYWATHGGAYVKDSTISFYSLNPTVGILNYTGEDVRNLVFARRVVNTCPENKFKTTVVGLYDAKQISGTDALADNVWKLYIPKDADGYDEEYAYNVVSYVFNYTTSFQKRVTDFVDDKFNIYDVDAKELTNKDKFEIATGYVGLLSSLYVVAEAQGADRVAASYEKAINDYLSNNNIKAQPVTLLVDTCQVYREAGTATQSIMPSIDVLELSLASQASYSVLEGDGAFLETLNKQGARVTTAKTGIPGFTMRQQLHEIAAASLEAYPYNTTKGYATGSNDVTQKKILRLADMPTSRTKWYTNSQHNHPLGYCLPVVSLSSKSAGSGGQGAIWTRDNNKVHWVTWDWDRNDGHFLDIFHTGEDGFLDGWAIVGSHFSDPTPTASFFVVDTIQGTPDTCEEYVQIITPSKLTITIGQGSDFLSYLDTLPEDSKISLEASISRKEYKDSLKSTPVEVIEHLTDLEDDLFLDQVSVEVFKSKITNTITLEDSYFVDSDGAPKTYQRLKNNPMLVLFEYEVDLTLTIDNTVYEFKSDDIVARVGDTPQNSSSFQIKAYKADADAAPDVEIIAPTDRTKPDYNHNPSANENLAELTQVIRWYEYTSVMGSMSSNVDASFGSTMGYDDTSVDADIGAFAEIKSNTVGDEKYEVLGGIPSTEELYFSVGGSEWKVSMILQYWMNEHSRERTYTIQFDGTTCEFNNNKKGEGDIWEGINLPSASGATQTITRFDHTGATVTATWTGEITNKATAVTKDGKATHSVTVTAECPAQVDNSAYTTAVSNANAWIKSMNDLTSSLKWKAASDEKERTVTYSLSDLGTGKASQTQGAADNGSGTYTCTSNGNNIASANYSFSYSNPKDTSKTETFTVSCNYSPPDSEGNGGSPCTNEQASGSVTAEPDSSKPFSITVTYKIEAHALCGPCCGHELPALWDTWKQGMVFDYMKISQIRLFLLDQGSVEGMTELTGTDRITASVVSGNPTYFMNIATMTEQYEDPYMVAGGLKEITGPKAQGNTWYTGTLYEPNNPYGYKSLGTYNNREAQSSRAGRIRYLLDPVWAADAETTFDYKYGPGGTTDAVGGTKSGTITIDYNKVANPKQHDDVIYKVGTRTPNCDGMATSGNFGKDSSLNSNPTLTTGHVNKWADGMLYTNILNTEDYTGYWNDANVASIASTYEPKELRENDQNLVKYREDYGHHLAEDGLVKTDYGHHADIVDTRTAEWQVFNAARTTKIIGIVISDFLIMQTSGGDQSVFYFEKASVPTEAQEHFQKVSIPEAEMTTDNPLSIFNAAAVCEESTIKDGVANFEIVGGYNGRYDDPANKYRPYSLVTQEYLNLGGYDGNNWNVYNASYETSDYQTRAGEASDYSMYGNTKIVTIFDDDPAGSFNRPKRQAETTGLKIYQDNLQILPTTPNRYYQPTDASIWYVQVVGTYSAGGHFMNKQSGGYGVWTAGNVNLGWPYRERYGDAWFDYWGSSIGLQLNTKYYLTKDGDSNTSSVNGVVVYTPVSAEDALVLPQGDLTVNGITVSRDQRVESFTFPDMNEVVNALKVCTLDPATCEYRFLDCKYLHDTVVAEFDFEDTTKTADNRYYVTNNVTGVEYLLPTGFSVTSGTTFGSSSGKYLNATGTNAWSIPFADLGIANDKTNRVKVSMDLKVNATSGNTMVVGFRNLGFVISSGGEGKFLVPYDEDPTIVGTSKSFTNTMKTVHLDIIFGFNNIVDCTAYVNGQEATVNQILDYRNEWTEKTENGKKVQRLEKTHVVLAGEKLKLSPPDNFTTADIMASINIGTWSNTDTTYTANFYLDNLNIILMGGTTEHTSACYVTSTTHAVSKVHVCNEDCWLKEDLYTCDGLPNANYQLGCGKEEGIPKVTVNTSVDFEYKGYGQVVTLTPGTYKLEVWGAQGGGTYGGKGGYSYGNLVVTQTTDFYVYVGSRGSDYDSSVSGYQTASGGFNGGGDGYGDQGAAGGGGATDIRRAGTALSNRIIVAGGGGGQAVDSSTYYGGVGGGSNGTAGYSGGTYGTQSSGYALGEGGDGSSTCSSPDNGGGGGGYYGGYGGSDDEGAGGGGSGYIGGVTSGGITIAGNASMTQPDGTTATGHSGNGYARITVVSGGGTITTDDFSSLEYGVPTTYTYSGDYEEITLEPGLYVVELYGAEGGYSSANSSVKGSKGTYVKGELTVTETTTAYLYIGGAGVAGHNKAGGFNGGGTSGGCSCGSGSGGGATDIRIGGTDLSNRVMVAGGGGGAGTPSYPGYTTSQSNGKLLNGSTGNSSDGGGGGGGYHGGRAGISSDLNKVDIGGYIGTSYVNGTEYTSDVNSGNTIVTHNSNSGNGYIVITPKGHVHSGTAGLDYANGCYTVPTVHKHDVSGQIKELICGLDEGGDGQIRNYNTVGAHTETLSPGRYKLEVWGAQGGTYSTTYKGGMGGYSVGVLNLTTSTNLWIYVGGQGGNGNGTASGYAGGFNGGGTGTPETQYDGNSGGGGGTDIRIGADSLYARVIVAGGGGGSAYYSGSGYVGGYGGGETAGNGYRNGYTSSTEYISYGASISGPGEGTYAFTTSGNGTRTGAFGVGASSSTNNGTASGGGGGWFGGASGYNCGTSGGGGSGFVYTSSTSTYTSSSYTGGTWLLNSNYYLTDAQTIAGNTSFTAPGGGTETGHSGDGYARITNLDHTHTDACYKTTSYQTTCDKIPAGTYRCTGEPNATTNFNIHEHTVDCLYDYYELTPRTYNYVGDVITYKVPYTDDYRIEAYGASSGTRSGYTSAVVRLKRGDILYFYIGGRDGFNNGHTDVRVLTSFYNYNQIMGIEDDIEREEWLMDYQRSLDSRFLNSATSLTGSFARDVGEYTLSNPVVSEVGNSSDGRIIITPQNRLPVTNIGETIFEQIVNNKLPLEEIYKYLGTELADMITAPIETKNVTVAPLATPVVVKTATSGSGNVSLTPGVYLLEATGAQGTAGEGGMASGWLTVTSRGTYYYNVGGSGAYTWINSSNSATNALVKAGSGAMKGVDAVVGGYTTHTHTADCGSITYTISSDDDSGAHHCAELYVSAGSYYICCSYGNRDTYLSMTTPPSNATLKTSAGWVYNDCDCGGSDEDNCDYDGYIVAWTPASNYTCNNLPLNSGYITPVTGVPATAEQASSTYNVKEGKTVASASIQQSIKITRYVDLTGYTTFNNLSYTVTNGYTASDSNSVTTFGTYTYQGKGEVVSLPAGTYIIEAWGAQGGSNTNYNTTGKLGGYVKGTYKPSSQTDLFIVVGGQGGSVSNGIDSSSTLRYNGGFNGGGSGSGSAGPGGGGATHIQIGSTGKILKNNYGVSHANTTGDYLGAASGLTNLLMIAGGGGGGSTSMTGTISYSNGQNGNTGYYNSSSYYEDNGGGGAGYKGGVCGNSEDAYYGGSGTSYTNSSYLSSTSSADAKQSGNGKVVISRVRTIYTNSASISNVTFSVPISPLEKGTAGQIIDDNFTLIPDMVDGDYNPIFICKFQEKTAHECSIKNDNGEIQNLCVTTVRLDCTEPHHKGVRVDEFGNTLVDKYDNPICKEHYAGSNRICWSACGNDDNHKLTKTEVDVDEDGTTVLQLAEYLQIDEGFTVYFPNRGNFYGNGLLGLSAPQTTRGYGYYNNMDTTRWTREKRVMFPFPVIYENLTYPAYTWIELEVSEVYFNFYLPVSTAEMANARVVFEVEAINCGTKQGTNPLYDIEYSSVVDNAYTDALNTFIDEYLPNYQADVKATGYKIIRAKSEEDKAGVGHRLAYSEVGILKFLETKQDRVNGEVAELVKALEKIDRQVEYDFEGDKGDYINPNATVDNGINNALKPLTFNDNRYRFDNTLRSDSYQSLHGGYKKFYLDVIGRIGNFAITDTEDFRFSNFFKVSIDNIPENTTFDATDPNNWLVDGLVKQVDENIQNYYVGDLYDIRGNKASVNTRWLDTYGTQGWMAGTYENGDRNINKKNLVSQILTGDVNTIDVLKNEELRFGYDIFTSIVTMGSYQEGQVQIIPKYYALKVSDKTLDGVPAQFNVKKGEYVPLDVYVNKDGAYEPVNIFGNAANGNSNKGNVQLSDYVFNLDWTNEAGRRNFSLDEQARTNRVKEYYRTFIYDMSAYEDPSVLGDDMASDMNIEDLSIIDVIEYVTPQGETNYLGTPQYILLDGRHRTFIGDSKSYDNNIGGEAKWYGPDEMTNFGLDKGIYPNAYAPDTGSPLEQIEFERSVQRWHSKIGLPSSAVFVPHGQAVNATTLDYVMGENEDEWVIVCTAEIIAVGAIWNINYSQPWFSDLTIGDATFKTHKHTSGCTCNKVAHYPGHKVTDPNTGATVTCPWCIDPIIAVFGKTSVEDVEISQIY